MKSILPIFALLCVVCGQIIGAERKPNVIFILTDDQGWNDAHFAGHPYVKTPNLDKFASQSTWFQQFYVTATVCSPSRAAFMTSHYPARHLVHGHFATHEQNAARSMPDWLDPKAPTLASLLKGAGGEPAGGSISDGDMPGHCSAMSLLYADEPEKVVDTALARLGENLKEVG